MTAVLTSVRPRTGRRTGRSITREAILAAARAVFGERGYEVATVRAVAARAAVDPALIYHYFGSKQQLFVAAMELPAAWRMAIPALASGPREQVGERMARFMLGLWDDPAVQPLLVGLLRSAVSDPLAAGMVRRLLTEGPLLALAEALGAPDGGLRAMLAGSHLVGVGLLRHILRVEPLASADLDALVRLVGPTLQRYLVEDLSPLADPAPSPGRPARKRRSEEGRDRAADEAIVEISRSLRRP